MLAILPTFSQPSRAKANVSPMMNVYWVRFNLLSSPILCLNVGNGFDYCLGSTGIVTNSPFLSHTILLFQKVNFLKLKDIVKLEIAKTMFCFNKSSAKNASQTNNPKTPL